MISQDENTNENDAQIRKFTYILKFVKESGSETLNTKIGNLLSNFRRSMEKQPVETKLTPYTLREETISTENDIRSL